MLLFAAVGSQQVVSQWTQRYFQVLMLLQNFVLQAGRPLWELGEVWCHLDVRIGGNGCVAGVQGQNKRGLRPPGNLPLNTYALGSQPLCCKEAQATRSGSRHSICLLTHVGRGRCRR